MRHWLLRPLAVACGLFLLSSVHAQAEKRIALVIGNSAYKNVVKLTNPTNDATAVAALLKLAGFDVVESKNNLDNSDMRRAVRDFTEIAQDADIAVVYYAGHGIEVNGNNYLIPTDAVLQRDIDVDDETVSLDRLINSLASVKLLRLVILDACRDNPFAKNMKRTIASRSIGRGLAEVEPNYSNTLVAFAAKAGSSPRPTGPINTAHSRRRCSRNIALPGLDIRLALGRVRDEVFAKTSRRQEPFVYGSLGGSTVALVPAPEQKPQRVEPTAPSADSTARSDYDLTREIGTREAWESFMAAHGAGFYYNLAKAARDKAVAAEEKSKREEGASQKAADEEAKRKTAEDAKRRAAEEIHYEDGGGGTDQGRSRCQTKAEADAEARAEADAMRKAEAEAKLKAEVEARRKAELETILAAEQAKRLAEQKAQAETEAKAKLAAQQAKAATPTVVALAIPNPAIDSTRKPDANGIDAADIASQLQFHLKRVGCDPGALDGAWNDKTMHAMALFNSNAHTDFDVKVASLGALEAVKQQKARICPLVCGKGYRVEHDSCVAIACKHGQVRNGNGDCVQEPKATARSAEPNSSASGGQIYCDRNGCRPLAKNCHVIRNSTPAKFTTLQSN